MDSRGDIDGRNITGNDLIATNAVITPVISLAGVSLATDLADVKADIVTAQAAANDAQTDADANNVILAAATHIDGGLPDTLVKRSAVNGTSIDNLVVAGREADYNPAGNANGLYAEGDYPPPGLTVVDQYATGQINMLQHCNLSFSPYDNATPAAEILTKNFYFGRAPPLENQTVQTADSDRDGLFIEDSQSGQTTLITCVDTEPNIKIEANKTKSGGKPVIPAVAIFDPNGVLQYAIYEDGTIRQKGHINVDSSTLSGAHHKNLVLGSNSLYLGRCRFSFTGGVPTAHVLKNQIPIYLTANGVTQGDLPAAHATMDTHAFVAFARNHFSNTKLEVEDIFPVANADWDDTFFDGHAGTAVVDANTANIATNATNIATNASGIASAGVAISTNATDIATKQDALSFGNVTDTGKVVLSENIKSYVDSSGGGFTFQGDSGTSDSDWKIDGNVQTVDVDDWYLHPTLFGSKHRVSIKLWFTNNGWRSIILKYDQNFLKHTTQDVDFHYEHTANSDVTAGNRDMFYGGPVRYSISMTNGRSFVTGQPTPNNSWDEDCLVIRLNCQTPSTVFNSNIWMNVRVMPISSRYYHEDA